MHIKIKQAHIYKINLYIIFLFFNFLPYLPCFNTFLFKNNFKFSGGRGVLHPTVMPPPLPQIDPSLLHVITEQMSSMLNKSLAIYR